MSKTRKPQKTSNSYWAGRITTEKQWIAHNIADDDRFNRKLQAYYDQSITNITQLIDSEYARLGDNDLARQKVSQMDVKAYASKAKSIVQEAQLRIKAGDRPTYADYSQEVNARLKLYNATMRINRLEYIKSMIGLEMVRSGLEVDADLRDKLSDDYMQELTRQAGIMSDSLPNTSLWTATPIAKQVLAQNAGATFSQRLWANQDVLKAKLDQVMASGILAGQNPRVIATHLRDQVRTDVTNQRYVTERLARTESARIQYQAQTQSIKDNGYRYVKWIAEPKACPICTQIVRADNGFGPGVYTIDTVPSIPEDTHPNCRCAISAWWID
ncbi:minor capsid protein [Limosilactobacillus fermentum]